MAKAHGKCFALFKFYQFGPHIWPRASSKEQKMKFPVINKYRVKIGEKSKIEGPNLF